MKKYIIFFSCLLSLFSSQAASVIMEIVVRNKNFRITRQVVELHDLTTSDAFKGKYFSIHLGKDTAPISFNASKEVLLKAATVYYHLTKARQFFLEIPNYKYLKKLPHLVIRINLTNDYDQLGLFANDLKNPQYNNALTVPPGKGYAAANIKPWAFQIWFRPSKRIHISELRQTTDKSKKNKNLLNKARKNLHQSNGQQALISLVNGMRAVDDATASFNVNDIVSSGVLELFYQASPVLEKVLSRKFYYLETALLPEVIYHEYCHVALSKYLPTTHSKAVIEGLADYFATRIANHHRIANKAKKYSTFKGKNARNDVLYQPIMEQPDYANADFVLGLLWDIKVVFGESFTDELVLNACKSLNTSSDIKNDFTKALLNACKITSTHPIQDGLKLYKILGKRGV